MKLINQIKLYWLKVKREVEKYPVLNPEIRELLEKKFKNCKIEIEDWVYYTCDYQTAKTIASLIPSRFFKYKEEFDCDNFSRVFWGFACVFPRLPVCRINVKKSDGSLHSLNGIIYRTKSGRNSFSMIEPQSGLVRYYNYRPYLIIL